MGIVKWAQKVSAKHQVNNVIKRIARIKVLCEGIQEAHAAKGGADSLLPGERAMLETELRKLSGEMQGPATYSQLLVLVIAPFMSALPADHPTKSVLSNGIDWASLRRDETETISSDELKEMLRNI